ncbi:aminopeptidase [Marinobacter litoralis]|uniref:aminopeptidase n=1 Tax=Marinobacter litoralis TaxID=187981 RepID=UPI0018EDC893|nr:aminopeptidase [Marinobacter litoralis]MBJ6136656.1 aminopeptidase [Marinobacter litoralis]
MKQLSQVYLILLLLAALQGCSSISYYTQAISGHVSLMVRSKPVNEVLQRPDTPPELSHRLSVAQAARIFAEQTLKLPVGGAFSSFVPLEHSWVVVNLVAAPEFSLNPKQWCYPFVGCQAYRGYFDLAKAKQAQRQFDNDGYDTFIGAVTAYSTLGWFDDPLHTGFTSLSEDRMVALMFHELAHRVVYLNGDTAFNESFATAVELEGLRLWLERQGQPDVFERALLRLEHRNRTLELVGETSKVLRRLYQQQSELGPEQLRVRKQLALDDLADQYAALSSNYPEPGPLGSAPVQLNNAKLALFQQYNQHVPAFRQLLKESAFNFEQFYEAVARLSELPGTERRATLNRLSERFHEHF